MGHFLFPGRVYGTRLFCDFDQQRLAFAQGHTDLALPLLILGSVFKCLVTSLKETAEAWQVSPW